MHTRRQFLSSVVAMAAGLGLSACGESAHAGLGQEPVNAGPAPGALNTRAIPASGERIPVIGMGTSGSFQVGASDAERDPLRQVLERFFAAGASVIDTAPTYGGAEAVLGALLAEQSLRPKAWLATKLSGVNGREEGLAQFNTSLADLHTDKVELLQVHNLGDLKAQLALARELKAQGKTRYVGVTHYQQSAHDQLADIVQAEKPDFLQINYSVASRGAEQRVLPLARDLGVAVMINRAFEDGRLFAQLKGTPLPGWAAAAGVSSWAQMLLRFALSHPAVTVVIPATGKPDRQSDNLRAGIGPDLDQAQRQSLIQLFG